MTETLTAAELTALASLAPHARRHRRNHPAAARATQASTQLTQLMREAAARGVSRAALAAATGMSVQAVGTRVRCDETAS